MSAAAGQAAWKITGEDRAKHDSQFFQLKPVNGFITGEQARGFFLQSGLPTAVLGQIWQLADMNNDGKMDKKEFSIAMHLIKKKLQGYELPKTLPQSLKADPSPAMGSFGTLSTAGPAAMSMGMPVMGMASTAVAPSSMGMPIMTNGVPMMGQQGMMVASMGMPGSMMVNKPRTGSFGPPAPGHAPAPQPAGNMAMPHASKLKYTQVFNSNDRHKRGHLTGVEARSLLVQSGLPQPVLAQIWALADYDKDGKLTCDEFCVAMHLADVARMGTPLPAVLPPELVPSKSRSGSFSTPAPPTSQAPPKGEAFGDRLGNMGMPLPQPVAPVPAATNGEDQAQQEDHGFTFEDRRKENFDKGQAELERRRQMLQEQMKRENEARMEKERQEQEKREKIRQEQERRRLAEMERQMEKQRQIEREREEQRQKMMEQREAARRELERQRQMEWERQRKEQLLSEKAREYEQLGTIKSRASNLKCELESQQCKKTEIRQKIEQVRNGVTDFTNSIEGMRITRDSKNSAIDKLQKEIRELGDKLVQLQSERESLNYRVQTSIQNNPLSDAHRTVLHGVELKKTSLQKLKKELENIERETESKLLEIDKNNTELEEMKKKLSSVEDNMSSLKKQQQLKQETMAQQKKKQEEEHTAKIQQEKDKQEKLRKDLAAQRIREQEEEKARSTPTSDAWAAFSNDTQASSTSNDIWSAAFADVKTDTAQGGDIWGSSGSSQQTAVTSSKQKGCKYKALYPFEARNPDELTLNPEDIVWVPEDQTGAEDGWMGGEIDGRKGWFPKDYVEKLPEEQSSQFNAFGSAFSSEPVASAFPVKESLYNTPADSPTPGQGATAPEGLQAQALYPWKAKKENHLSFNKGDIIQVKEQQEMWWSGNLNGQTGWFPKSYVKMVSGPTSKQISRSGTPAGTSSAPAVTVEINDAPAIVEHPAEEEPYVAMYSYTSSEPGDLTFNQGQLIQVTKKDGDWWTGSIGERSGIFPANYVKAAEQQAVEPDSQQTLDSVITEQGFVPVDDLISSDSLSDPGLLKSTQTLPPSQTDTAPPPFPSPTTLDPSLQNEANPQPPVLPPDKPKPVEKSVTFEDPFSGEIFFPSDSMATEVKDTFGSKDAVNSPFGDDPFSSDAFSGDPFASETPFSNDTPFSEKEDPFNSIDFLSSESFGESFHKFNVGVSTQTSVDPNTDSNNEVMFDLMVGTENEANISTDLTSLGTGVDDTTEVVLRKSDTVKLELTEASSSIELSQYFPDLENNTQEGEASKDGMGDDLFGIDFGNSSVEESMKNFPEPDSAENANQETENSLQDNFSFLQTLSASAVSTTQGASQLDLGKELDGVQGIENDISESKLGDNFAFIQNLSERSFKPKLEEIKQHSVGSSVGDYDDCSFMKTSIDEPESQADNDYDDLGDYKRSCDPSPQSIKETDIGDQGEYDNLDDIKRSRNLSPQPEKEAVIEDQGDYDNLDDILRSHNQSPQSEKDFTTESHATYDDLDGYIRNSETPEEVILECPDQYDDFDFVKPVKDVEKIKSTDFESGVIRDESYDDILNFPSESRAVEKMEGNVVREDDYNDCSFLESEETGTTEDGEIIQDNSYVDIIEYDKIEKPAGKNKKEKSASKKKKEKPASKDKKEKSASKNDKEKSVSKNKKEKADSKDQKEKPKDIKNPKEKEKGFKSFSFLPGFSKKARANSQPTNPPLTNPPPTIPQPAIPSSNFPATNSPPQIPPPALPVQSSGSFDDDEDDTYEPIEKFRSLITGSSNDSGEATPSPTPATQVAAPQPQPVVAPHPQPVAAPQPQPATSQPALTQQKAGTSSTLKKPEIASVIAAYTATGAEQLSLNPGQLIQVRKKSPSGWWEGELQARGQKKKIGWFPANYVKILGGGSSARSTPDSSSQNNSPASTLHRTATPTIPAPQPQKSAIVESKYVDQVIALYPYSAQNEDELTFHKDSVINVMSKDDADWWQGEVNGTVGMFPSNYVGALTSPPQENTWSSDPAVLAQTSSVESKRQNYIHELINTEETYMADMSIVLDAFYEPMANSKVMTQEELDMIFVNWKELILCNTKLLKSVRVRKKMCGKGQVIQIIGDVLCENIPHMTPYIRFCSCQLNAAALIQRYTENSSEFKEIQKKCVQNPKTKGMPLSSFLLKPMQRITKYPLMIQKILQYTPETHPDRQNLEDALAKAEELCSQVNEGVRERENCDKLEWMQNHVQCEGLQERLIFNSVTNCLGPRKLLYHGTMYKAKGHKELVGFLFNDFLLLATPLSSATSNSLFDAKTKAQYRMYKSPIFLNEVMVRRLGEDDNDCLFQVSHVDRVYNLKAPNLTERESWVRHIDAASKLFLDTEKQKREKLYNLGQKSHMMGRLLVIIQEGINLAPTADVRKINGVGRLLVVLLEGCDLQASDVNGKSDPYCEVSMGVQEHKTKVIQATLNPRWNASMQFTIKDLEQDVLCITVFDRDLFSPNDFLGRTEMRVNDILTESRTRKGPITKRLLLHEVSSGEVVVKLDLQLYDNYT